MTICEVAMELRNEKGQTLEEFLAEYDENLYRRPSNTVDIILLLLMRNPIKTHQIK